MADLMEHLAMSNPQVSFKFLLNGQNRFYTTGSGDLREIVYRIYGKDIADALMDFHCGQDGMTVTGLLGKPVINRANRSYEIFYINGRYIRSTLISKAVEEGYREYLMQHKFPFCILHFQIDTEKIDVNVHPSKMEVRIADAPDFYETVRAAVEDALREREMIPEVSLSEPEKTKEKAAGGSGGRERERQRRNRSRKEGLRVSMMHPAALCRDSRFRTWRKCRSRKWRDSRRRRRPYARSMRRAVRRKRMFSDRQQSIVLMAEKARCAGRMQKSWVSRRRRQCPQGQAGVCRQRFP